MSAAQWQKVQELFEEVLDLEPEKQAVLLGERCADDPETRAEVQRLLDVDARVTAGSDPFATDAPRSLLEGGVAAPGMKIGEFEIVRVIASGGMGTVYEARQSSPDRAVALKALRLGPTSDRARRRFEYEAQVLGRLRHPHIAQVHASGTFDDPTTGRTVPWFTLELVENAQPVDLYTAAAGLSLDGVLALFETICDAVHHGHLRGIVHRDLKPANILVDGEGRVKVIDFGIARCLEVDDETARTVDGELLGTPLYMSPEQLRTCGDAIDGRADVYALGVVLYELISGVCPFEVRGRPLTAVVQAVLDETPPPPSSRRPELPVELDWIVARAMAKDRTERYPSAAELLAEVRRVRAREPVLAGPPTTIYRVRKWVQRHRLAFAGMLLFLFGLVAFSVVTTVLWIRADDAERLAATRADELADEVALQRGVNRYITDLVQGLRPENRTDAGQLRGVLDRAAEGAEALYADRPVLELRLRIEVGRTYRDCGYPEPARPHLTRALELARELRDDYEQLHAVALEELGNLLSQTGEIEAAEGLLRESLECWRALSDVTPRSLSTVQFSLGSLLYRKGDLREAADLLERAYESVRDTDGGVEPENLSMLTALALCCHALREDRAPRLAQRAVEIAVEDLGPTNNRTLSAKSTLATILVERSEHVAALPVLQEIAELTQQLFGADSAAVRRALQNLAAALYRSDDLPGAIRRSREALALETTPVPETIIARCNLVRFLGEAGESEAALEEADVVDSNLAGLVERGLPEGHWLFGIAKIVRGRALTAARRFDDAEAVLRSSLSMLDDVQPQKAAQARKALADLYDAWGRPDDAARLRDSARGQ